MSIQEEGYFIWQSKEENYFQASNYLTLYDPPQSLQLSQINKEARPILLQAIWCKRNGFVNTDIGQSEQQDRKIAGELGVW